jgi:RimJ/RimL family protein N-acetyltransferase
MEFSPAVAIPRLTTERLLLREYRERDFDAYAASVADGEVNRFTGVLDRKHAYRVFAAQMGSWILRGAGWWAIEVVETGELAGRIGAFYRDGFPDLEVGWFTHRAFWRRGIASEAAAEVVRYAFARFDIPRVTAFISAGNTASLRIAERLGMRYEREAEIWDTKVGMYALDRSAG